MLRDKPSQDPLGWGQDTSWVTGFSMTPKLFPEPYGENKLDFSCNQSASYNLLALPCLWFSVKENNVIKQLHIFPSSLGFKLRLLNLTLYIDS